MANKYTTFRHVSGAGELTAALAALAQDVRTGIITEAVEATVVPIEDTMKAIAPVKTGEYRDSIKSKVVPYPANAKAVGLVGATGRARNKAHLLEYGHLVVSPQKGKTIRRGTAVEAKNGRTHVAARPHIRPAVYSTLAAQAALFTGTLAAGMAKHSKAS